MLSLPLRAVLVAGLLLGVSTSGCLSFLGNEPVDDGPLLNESAGPDHANATLPDGRGESSGLKETNKTESGTGGRVHQHDYWLGRNSVIVFEDEVPFYTFPLYPNGEGSEPASVAYVKLPQPNLVFEGTGEIDIEARNPTFGGVESPITHPAAPTLRLQYRDAASVDWSDPQPLPYDSPLTLQVDPQATDMPHSVQSLWVFRLLTDRPVYEAPDLGLFRVSLTISTHRARDVVDWPGHPDFYADSPQRVVLDDSVQTHMSGIQEGILYDSGGTWVHPEKLISHGTERVEVFINVTQATNAYNAEATGFFLEFHNATIIGPEITFGERLSDPDGSEDLKAWNFTVPVDHQGMDGPYQPASRWGFRLMATFANVGVPDGPGVGLCPGCFPYDIAYDIKLVAHGSSTPADDLAVGFGT